MKNKLFVPLHLHSDASFLDSLSSPEKLVTRAKELGYESLAVTDHGNVHNFIRMSQECKKQDIKFVPGCEFYFTDDHKEKLDTSNHLTILAKNNAGLKSLYKLTTWSNVPVDMGGGFYRRPRISWRDLEKCHDGLICLTGCMNSPVNQAFLSKDSYAGGKIVAQKLQSIFGEDLVVEIQNVNDEDSRYIPEHDVLMKFGRRLAKSLKLRRVATNDSHYINRTDERAHEVLKCISTGSKLSDPVAREGRPGRIKFKGHDYHLKSDEEMRRRFDDEEIDTTADIAAECNVTFKMKQNFMPRFDVNMTELEAYNKLVVLVKKGWYFWKLHKQPSKMRKVYLDRLRTELKDIREAELTDYFLIVWDVMKFVDDQKIGRGFSRGSAGGSLVSYCLNVCLMDPIEYGLIWERFWNRGRKGSMPDIDLDICVDRRDEVIDYLTAKFGKSKVFPMMTLGKFMPKAVIKDVGKAFGLPFDYVNILSKKVPAKPRSIDDSIERSEKLKMASKGKDEEVIKWREELKELKEERGELERSTPEWFRVKGQIVDLDNRIVERSKKLVKTFEMAKKLEKIARQRGKHACALLISHKSVMGRVPLVWDTTHKSLITGFDMRDLENMGYLKLDVLGLANATVISRILPGGIYDIISKGFNDKKVFDLIGTGNCKGVFQLESPLGRKYAKMMKPHTLEEVSDLVSILRPGTLETGLTDQYLKNRAKGRWKLVHEDLRPIFDPTYGIMCYQEQMLEVVKKFGGFDLAHADLVRKACGKKLPEEMEKHEKDFAAGCKKNGYKQHVIDKLWEWINAAAGYTFNKCISGETVCYRSGAGRFSDGTVTIAHLYKTRNNLEYAKQHNCVALRKKLRRVGYGSILALDDDKRIRPRNIKDIYFNGRKRTYTVTLSNGNKIRATKDHKIMTTEGMIRIEDFVVDSTVVLCDGGYETTDFSSANSFSDKSSDWKSRPYVEKQCGFPEGADNPAYTTGSFTEFEQSKTVLACVDRCQRCNKDRGLQHHHINGDRSDSRLQNIEKLCDSCHKIADYALGKRKKRWEKGHQVEFAIVESIEYFGWEDTYDIEMDTEEHNFVANGIVTSNSHGVGYGMLTYATAYLKCHHKLEFFTVLLQLCHYSKNKPRDEISEIFYDAKLHGVDLVGPSLKMCNVDFVNDGKQIYFGMKHIRNIGDSASQELQKFKGASWTEIVINRKKLKKQVVQALIYSGSLDYTGMTRLEMVEAIDFANSLTDRESMILESLMLHGRPVEMGRGKVVNLGKAKNFHNAVEMFYDFINGENVELKAIAKNRSAKLFEVCGQYLDNAECGEELPFRDKAGKEILYLGIPATCSETEIYKHKRATHTCIQIKKSNPPGDVCVIGVIMEINRKIDRKNNPMAFIKLADKTYMMEGMLFNQTLSQYGDQLQEGKVVLVRGRKSRGALLISKVKQL